MSDADRKLRQDIDRFLASHPGNPYAVLAVHYLGADPSLLQRLKDQFRDDPIFALHYLSKFADDPEYDQWLETALKGGGDNAAPAYFHAARLVELGKADPDDVLGALRQAAEQEDYDIHRSEIDELAFEFLKDFRGKSGLDAAKTIAMEVAPTVLFQSAPIMDLMTKHMDGASQEKQHEIAATMMAMGTKLSGTGDSISIAIGLGIEGIYRGNLGEVERATFDIPDAEAAAQAAEEKAEFMRSLDLVVDENVIERLTDENHQEFLNIRSSDGPVASFLFLENYPH